MTRQFKLIVTLQPHQLLWTGGIEPAISRSCDNSANHFANTTTVLSLRWTTLSKKMSKSRCEQESLKTNYRRVSPHQLVDRQHQELFVFHDLLEIMLSEPESWSSELLGLKIWTFANSVPPLKPRLDYKEARLYKILRTCFLATWSNSSTLLQHSNLKKDRCILYQTQLSHRTCRQSYEPFTI